MHRLERNARENGRDYALRTLKENIITLQLAPGSQISENELAAEMGLSRTPVREALIELSKVRIIEIFPQRKTIVSLIDYDLVEEARFMRFSLEMAVIELVCKMATDEDIKRLQENVRLQNFYVEQFNPDRLMELDNQFHQLLFEIARKPQVFTLMQNIAIHFDRVRNLALSLTKDLKIVQDHENLTIAIANRDVERAKQLMEKHLNRYKVDRALIQEKYSQYIK